MSTQESLSRLEANVKKMASRNRNRMTRMVIIQAVLLIFVVGYLTWAHSMIAQVTPDDIVVKLQQKAIKEMPALSSQLADKLNAYAPELMVSVKEKVLGLVPMVGKKLEVQVDIALGQITTMVKEKLASAEEIIKKEKEALDLKTPKLPDNEQIDLLLKNVRAKFRENVVNSTAAIRSDYSKRMNDINLQLEHLTLDDKGLTEKEVLQKRLIEIWVKLIKMKTGGDILK
jgi:hypothetical protein